MGKDATIIEEKHCNNSRRLLKYLRQLSSGVFDILFPPIGKLIIAVLQCRITDYILYLTFTLNSKNTF